ncbi:hypothetical protein HMN09_01394800 [Mycena chlorophos]|uniref:Mitochondrial carrier n=1 Tax=Mycena chlorophos TaxID=658473 RepID=A0A8H6VSI0_MYCCL|nr:hypothetical protein HMN09_01394800 [Mycena chlorophos]
MGLVDELTPVLGLLVRYRANYTPRGGQLLEDGHAQRRARDEPGTPASFWRVFVRTRQVEGWLGLYKGFFPVALTSLLIPLAQYPATHLVVLLEPSSRGLGADETEPSVAALARYILASFALNQPASLRTTAPPYASTGLSCNDNTRTTSPSSRQKPHYTLSSLPPSAAARTSSTSPPA